jgi:hypothetical protein
MEIDIEDQWVPCITREHDASLMDLALQYNFSHIQLAQFMHAESFYESSQSQILPMLTEALSLLRHTLASRIHS